MGGDFNEILSFSDKFGENSFNSSRASHFWDCINQSNLIDLRFRGSKFTWTNKRYRNRSSLILERLDRCFANQAWIDLFPEASVTYLPRTHSDHSPLLICLKRNLPISFKPFKMETIWCCQAFQNGNNLVLLPFFS